jgi:hypothetical protein
MKRSITLCALLIALIVPAIAAAAPPTTSSASCLPGTVAAGFCHGMTVDPRACAAHSASVCGKTAAAMALRIRMSGGKSANWDAVITCRGFAGFLRYRCTWRMASTDGSSGAATVTFAPKSPWKPTVKL